MPSNTGFNPKRISEFNKDDLEYAGNSIAFTALENAETSGDFEFTEDHLITGGELIVEGGHIDDRLFFQVVHPVYGVIKEFIKNHAISTGVYQRSVEVGYPSKIPTGLKIRLKYVASPVVGDRKVVLNLMLHRILA